MSAAAAAASDSAAMRNKSRVSGWLPATHAFDEQLVETSDLLPADTGGDDPADAEYQKRVAERKELVKRQVTDLLRQCRESHREGIIIPAMIQYKVKEAPDGALVPQRPRLPAPVTSIAISSANVKLKGARNHMTVDLLNSDSDVEFIDVKCPAKQVTGGKTIDDAINLASSEDDDDESSVDVDAKPSVTSAAYKFNNSGRKRPPHSVDGSLSSRAVDVDLRRRSAPSRVGPQRRLEDGTRGRIRAQNNRYQAFEAMTAQALDIDAKNRRRLGRGAEAGAGAGPTLDLTHSPKLRMVHQTSPTRKNKGRAERVLGEHGHDNKPVAGQRRLRHPVINLTDSSDAEDAKHVVVALGRAAPNVNDRQRHTGRELYDMFRSNADLPEKLPVLSENTRLRVGDQGDEIFGDDRKPAAKDMSKLSADAVADAMDVDQTPSFEVANGDDKMDTSIKAAHSASDENSASGATSQSTATRSEGSDPLGQAAALDITGDGSVIEDKAVALLQQFYDYEDEQSYCLSDSDDDFANVQVSPESDLSFEPLDRSGIAALQTSVLAQMGDAALVEESDSDESSIPVAQSTNQLDDEPLPEVMEVVDVLSRRYFDPDGYPVYDIVVHGPSDAKLYEFKITVEDSLIPNAGKGAFMRYIGERQLRPAAAARGDAEWSGRARKDVPTRVPLEFTNEFGYPQTLVLKGENLHGNNNNQYWPEYLAHDKFVRMPGANKDIRLLIVSDDLLNESDGLTPAERGERIGHLGLYTEADYIVPTNTLSTISRGLIKFGRYGPFRWQDRKTETIFSLKDFLYSNQPMNWPYDMKDDLFGDVQVLDITDDTTGLVHSTARRNIPMYVNEVGHNSTLKQNVEKLDSEDGHIDYYIVFNDDSPLARGEKRELLVDYGPTYETLRGRKGYGLSREPDDTVFHALLKRNLVEREDVESIMVMARPSQLKMILSFMYESVWGPNLARAEEYVRETKAVTKKAKNPYPWPEPAPFACYQYIALMRATWLARIACDSVAAHREVNTEEDDEAARNNDMLLRQCVEIAEKIRWPENWDLLDLVDPLLVDSHGKLFRDAIILEIREEACYQAMNSLLSPYDESMWCLIARDLCDELCLIIHHNERNERLDKLLAAANKAIRRVDFETTSLSDFEFRSGLLPVPRKAIELGLGLSKTAGVDLALDYTTLPKAFLAELVDGLVATKGAAHGDGQFTADDRFVMCAPIVKSTGAAALLDSIPCKSAPTCEVQRTWYKVWMVAFVTHALASTCTGNTDEPYDIECLRGLDVDFQLVRHAIEVGIRANHKVSESDLYIPLQSQTRSNAQTACQSKMASGGGRIDLGAIPKSPAFKKDADTTKGEKMESKMASAKRIVKSLKSAPNARGKSTPRPKPRSKPKEAGLASTAISKGKNRPPAKLIWEGRPDEDKVGLPDGITIKPDKLPGGWPDGWTQQIFQRQSGDTIGQTDRYWFTPKLHKLRSMKEVHRFMSILNYCKDEATAWKLFKKP